VELPEPAEPPEPPLPASPPELLLLEPEAVVVVFVSDEHPAVEQVTVTNTKSGKRCIKEVRMH
jgi:hypothetical protein